MIMQYAIFINTYEASSRGGGSCYCIEIQFSSSGEKARTFWDIDAIIFVYGIPNYSNNTTFIKTICSKTMQDGISRYSKRIDF